MAAGSAVAMIGVPNLRPFQSNGTNGTKGFQCHPKGESEATIILSLALLGMITNVIMMSLILINKHLRRWSQGLLFHQGAVDCGRAAILLPLGFSILRCEPIRKCSLVETAFLLLVTVSTINMLTTLLNDSPIFPQEGHDEELASGPLLMDSPQCVFFGTFMIWFASITINLGPTFLSGALAARSEMVRNAPSCPLIHGPFRHYILNALWIGINTICILLTLFHLHKLHRDLTKANTEAVKVAGLVTTLVNVTGARVPTHSQASMHSNNVNSMRGRRPGKSITSALEEYKRMRNYLIRMEREGIQKVKMFLVITAAYIVFWGPLFFVTIVRPAFLTGDEIYEMTLHIAYVHASVNPTLFLVLHRGLRYAAFRLCCGFLYDWIRSLTQHPVTTAENPRCDEMDFAVEVPQANLLVPPPPPPIAHQQPVVAQINSSIKSTPSPYHRCVIQGLDSPQPDRQEFVNSISEKLSRKLSAKKEHVVYYNSPQTPICQHSTTMDAEIHYSGYSSCSE